MGADKPTKMPGHFMLSFWTKALAEKYRSSIQIKPQWQTTKWAADMMLHDALGNVPFVVFINDFNEATGFQWKVVHLIPLDKPDDDDFRFEYMQTNPPFRG